MANEGVLPISFMLTETFAIFSCCVVTYQNITSDTNTITRNENVQEITMGYVKKIGTKLGNSIFYHKVPDIWLQA